MTINTLFGDEIITSTDLKTDQKRWFNKAFKTPVSITNRGGKKFVLINREQVRGLFLTKEYAEKIVRYCHELREQNEKVDFSSDVFPWARNLSKEERLEYRDELMSAFSILIHNNNWEDLDEIISSWKATAEALANPEFMKVVKSGPAKRKYVEVE